ncbi:hypothetical protein GW17_00017593 [Ensete ventricosum]|nr:hypothetical protein GW17_00017593 [Ensete ventricosum]
MCPLSAAHTVDNALLSLSVSETEAVERIQKFFSTGAVKRKEEAHSVEATLAPTPWGVVDGQMTIMGLRFLPWPIFWGLRGHWLTRWGSRALCQSSPFLGVLQR